MGLESDEPHVSSEPEKSGSAAAAAGILLSRLSGLIREIAVSGSLGIGAAADAFRAAMRIPNVIQNLLGEGVLSASFIPVYSQEIDAGESERAGRLAGTIFGLLAATAGALSLIVIALAEPLAAILTPGLEGESRELTVELIRIMAPGTAFLVLSAWCLGILNSHRQFFLSYVAPVVWNATQITVAIIVGLRQWAPADVARALAWAVLAGGVLQFLVQVRPVLRAAPTIRLGWQQVREPVATVLSRFWPALVGRGAVQISAFVDTLLASLLITGALSALFAAQALYILPISVFAMSVAAAELPTMSTLDDDAARVARTDNALRRISFFIVFVAVAYIAAGDLIIGAFFQRGRFTADDTLGVWLILAAYSIGLPAAGNSRLLQNVSFSIGDTKGPARIAFKRVVLAAVIGVLLMWPLDQVAVFGGELVIPDDPETIAKPNNTNADGTYAMFLGAVGLALGSAIASWYELFALRRYLTPRVVGLISPLAPLRRLSLPAAASFIVAVVLKMSTVGLPLVLAMLIVVGVSGFTYVVVSFRLGITESSLVLDPVRKILWRR